MTFDGVANKNNRKKRHVKRSIGSSFKKRASVFLDIVVVADLKMGYGSNL